MTTTIVVTPIEFDGGDFELHGEAFHRFVRVKRLRGGESVRVVDGEGRARRGVVARLERARAVVALAGAEPSREPRLRVALSVAPLEPARAAWLVEKATELGVVAVRFVATERSFGGRAAGGARGRGADEGAYGASQLARLRRVAHAAVEQCGRALVPEIGVVGSLAARVAADQLPVDPAAAAAEQLALDLPPAEPLDPRATLRVALDPAGDPPDLLKRVDETLCPSLRVELFVGPEGGWSDEEVALFRAHGVNLVALGERILRVETAAVVAAALALSGFP
jgi:16S rRNA (uracil1498-N3)-methyltransferase